MDSIFTKMIRRDITVDIIYEDEYTFVIPDKFPSMPGQLLVISKRQTSYIFDLPEMEYQALMTTTKKVALALDAISGKSRTCIAVEGFEVPHVHLKLYPCDDPGIVLRPKVEAAADDLEKLAGTLRAKLK